MNTLKFVIRLEDTYPNKSTLFTTAVKAAMRARLGRSRVHSQRSKRIHGRSTLHQAEADVKLNGHKIISHQAGLSFFDTILIFFAAQVLRLPILVKAGIFSRLFFGKEQ